MASPTYRRPREFFGFGPTPLLGSQGPMLSMNAEQRFQNAGLGSFLPYLDPWQTMVRARDYRNLERQMGQEEAIQDAEARFQQAIQQDPQTGYQRFLAQNPLAVMSPMVRTYALTQDRLRQQQKQDRISSSAAELGSRAFGTYQKSRSEGKSDLEAFAAAVSEREKEERELKPMKLSDDRATLSGEPAEKLAEIMSEIYETPDPTDDEKIAFLPKDKDAAKATEADWTRAYYQAKQKKQQDAINRLRTFQATYGEIFKVPGTRELVPQVQQPAIQATPASLSPQAAPEPISAPNTPQAAVPPQNAPEAVSVPVATPILPRNEESEKLWSEYLDLENAMRVDAKSTNPSDREADREIRGEMDRVRANIMQRLKLPDTKEGRKLFENVWLGRKNSLQSNADSRGNFLSEPLRRTGQTGNSWVIRPA